MCKCFESCSGDRDFAQGQLLENLRDPTLYVRRCDDGYETILLDHRFLI